MGFPIHRISNLIGLCKGENYIVNQFSKYNAVAIVLHDPKDRNMCRVMKENFERLHVTTGDKFAFISFLTPPRKWADEHRYWMEVRESLLFNKGIDESKVIESLKQRLGLTDLPAILLTHNFKSPDYVLLRTDSYSIVPQMEQIGEFLSSQERRIPVSSGRFMEFLQSIGSAEAMTTDNGEDLCTNIAEIESVFMAKKKNYHDDMAMSMAREDSLQYLQDAIRLKRRKIETLSHLEEDNKDAIDRAQNDYIGYLSLILEEHGKSKGRHWDIPDIDYCTCPSDYSFDQATERGLPPPMMEFETTSSSFSYLSPADDRFECKASIKDRIEHYEMLEPFSKKQFETFERLQSFVNETLFCDIVDSDMNDYSILVVILGKIMEEELNASVVQKIRQISGIGMPEYYRKHCPEKHRVNIAKTDLNFLDYSKNRLKPVQIGNTIKVIEELNDPRLKPYLSKEFKNSVLRFAEFRNMASHLCTLSDFEYSEATELFVDILSDWLTDMYITKRELRS